MHGRIAENAGVSHDNFGIIVKLDKLFIKRMVLIRQKSREFLKG